jgi:hypothetical protein
VALYLWLSFESSPIALSNHARKTLVKTAAELESMIIAELREHPECESAAVVITGPTGTSWDTSLAVLTIP